MNAPILWIIIPGLAAGILYILRRWERGVTIAGVAICLLLTLLALRLPIGSIISLGPLSIKIGDTFSILGRRLVLADSERPILTLVYAAAAFWLGGAWVAGAGSLFVPIGLGVIVLLTASLAVDPFLYAALFIEMAALLCIPLLSMPKKRVGRGVLRFLSFQTLGAPLILFTGWLASELQTDPTQTVLALRATILVALGFAFLLAVFPFHTWMPMVSEESHPYATAFVFFMLPGIISVFAVKFLESNPWFGAPFGTVELLRMAGGLTVAVGGIWAAFQRHLGRMLAYAVMIETGLSLLVIAVQWTPIPLSQTSVSLPDLFFPLFLSRGLAFATWALALSVLYAHMPDLTYQAMQGAGRKFPIAASALILAHLSLAGFPLLAGFPVRLNIIDGLAPVDPLAVLWILIGLAGLLVGALRTLAVLVMGPGEDPWAVHERRSIRFFLIAGIAALILAGIFPVV
jgi:NADH-quinone oxidoreductase subunit N